MVKGIVDIRGYTGSEKNRVISPEEVVWARESYYTNKISARELAMKFGLSVDSVRRMLRSETYTNVGSVLPKAEHVERARELEDGGALERLLEHQRALDGQTPKRRATDQPGGQTEKPELEVQAEEVESALDLFMKSGKEGAT